jgi:hypothetical protein
MKYNSTGSASAPAFWRRRRGGASALAPTGWSRQLQTTPIDPYILTATATLKDRQLESVVKDGQRNGGE